MEKSKWKSHHHTNKQNHNDISSQPLLTRSPVMEQQLNRNVNTNCNLQIGIDQCIMSTTMYDLIRYTSQHVPHANNGENKNIQMHITLIHSLEQRDHVNY